MCIRDSVCPLTGSTKHIASGNKIAVIASAPFFLCPLFDIPYHSPIRVEKQTPPAPLDSTLLRIFLSTEIALQRPRSSSETATAFLSNQGEDDIIKVIKLRCFSPVPD